MQVVLLAAGLGSRLGSLTERLPKALIEVAGLTLLERAVGFARRLSPAEIIVVGGFGFGDVARHVQERALPVTLVENTAFRDGNLVSLMAARPRIDAGFWLMNVDHIYRPAIAERVRVVASEVTAYIDTDRTLGADDMKVARDAAGRVAGIAKTLTTFDCGYVGMTQVPGDARARYWATADAALAEEGRAIHVERVLARLAASARPPGCADISGVGWLEVDLQDERNHADTVVRGAPADWV
jgi:choline kinase